VSKGLGRTQVATLDLVAAEPGLTVPELTERLGSTPRRARKVVAALDERRRVRVRIIDGRRRVFLPEQLPQWERDEMNRKAHGQFVRDMTYRLHAADGVCPACGQALPKRQRPV